MSSTHDTRVHSPPVSHSTQALSPFSLNACSMYCNEYVDFQYTRSPSPTPPPHASLYSRIEREFCTNFSCCGLVLADLHELLDHFEEHHVVMLRCDGRPVHPIDPDVVADDDFTSCHSVILSYPQPDPPAVPEPGPDPCAVLASLIPPAPSQLHPIEPYLVASDTRTASHSDRIQPLCIPPSLLSINPPVTPVERAPPRSAPPRSDTGHAPARSKGGSKDKMPQHLTGHTRVSAKAQTLGGSERSPHAKKRAREKAYKCPKPDCSKSYLNPNGLKYHLEKGTCTTESHSASDS